MLTEIWCIDDDGNLKLVSLYTLPSKEALICFRQQNEFKNNNFWDYPKDDPIIKKFKNKDEYYYFKGENTSVFTKQLNNNDIK